MRCGGKSATVEQWELNVVRKAEVALLLDKALLEGLANLTATDNSVSDDPQLKVAHGECMCSAMCVRASPHDRDVTCELHPCTKGQSLVPIVTEADQEGGACYVCHAACHKRTQMGCD